MSNMEMTLASRRESLERRANVLRTRLLRTIDALDVRRHQVRGIGREIKRLLIPVAVGLVGLTAIGVGVALGIRRAVRIRRRRRIGYRVSTALARARAPRPPSFATSAFQRAALTVIGILASEVTKRSVKRVAR